jgi:hypothetical protein
MLSVKTSLTSLVILTAAITLALAFKPATTIFTCTTFFDFEKQDKWAAFCKAMDSILEKHSPETLQKIQRWVIVNEYSETPKADWKSRVAEKYPFIECIQKTANQKGQAASLNIILQQIKGYTYWIHWEETWYCRAPCLDRMMDVITTTSISQVQCTQHKEKPNWLDSETHPNELKRTPKGTAYYQIYPAPGTETWLRKSMDDYGNGVIAHWPLYSLLPSINRVSHNNCGDFPADPKYWPFRFEWDYGRRWLLAGNTKAVLPDGPVVRDNSAHKSTYD